MSLKAIPFTALETLFLDVGNTLIAMDLEPLRLELSGRGIDAELGALSCAEAAARPILSAALERIVSTEGLSGFAFYLQAILSQLEPAAGRLSAAQLHALAEELAAALARLGKQRLWSRVLPGVPAALEGFQAAGLRLVVVSNSDGTVESVLKAQGLRDFFDLVFDSHWVGFEKPDPRIFELALEASQSAPAHTLHVGDLYAADVAGARAAGIHALLLDPHGEWDGVDCARLPDLPALLEALRRARGLEIFSRAGRR